MSALYDISAYDLEDVCTGLGLKPPDDGERAFDSKRRYVSRRLAGLSTGELHALGECVYEHHSAHEELKQVLGRTGVSGVRGELKNLIFAANGPKPRIVLRDALNNVIEIVDNEEFCLVYDRPIPAEGLTWGALVEWWAGLTGADPSSIETKRSLYARLKASLSPSSPAETVLFDAYGPLYGKGYSGTNPVLIPQVYLHYDPYTRRENAQLGGVGDVLKRQRMDFLLLLSQTARVVIEVDGKQHYADGDRADPSRYGAMMAEDRSLRLDGYEVFRFGAAELLATEGPALARTFFDAVLNRYDP